MIIRPAVQDSKTMRGAKFAGMLLFDQHTCHVLPGLHVLLNKPKKLSFLDLFSVKGSLGLPVISYLNLRPLVLQVLINPPLHYALQSTDFFLWALSLPYPVHGCIEDDPRS